MEQQRQHSRETDLVQPVNDHDHWLGSTRPEITLIEYGDYQCPYCRQAYDVVQSIQSKLGQELKYVYRHFPLTTIHPMAELAAEAAEAAAAQGRFWEMHGLLYENQDQLGEDLIIEASKQFGLDQKRFLKEIESRQYQERVHEDFLNGVKSGVSGTPGFFINGFLYKDSWDEENLMQALRSLLPEFRWPIP
jgi:protein-disulfide isomerase